MHGSIDSIALFPFLDHFDKALVVGDLCRIANIKGYIEYKNYG